MKKTILYELNITREPVSNLRLLRVIQTPELTKIDFGYYATAYFIKGGWIRISPKTYLQIEGSDKKYTLTDSDNIPIAPDKYHFKSNKDWQFFSLYFPAIPQEDLVINLIEEENPDEHDFNFYGIQLNLGKAKRIFDSL